MRGVLGSAMTKKPLHFVVSSALLVGSLSACGAAEHPVNEPEPVVNEADPELNEHPEHVHQEAEPVTNDQPEPVVNEIADEPPTE